jgi:anti-sigma B factor antagonist
MLSVNVSTIVMKFEKSEKRIRFSDIPELSASRAGEIKAFVLEKLSPEISTAEFDLSRTDFLDSGGLGFLISIHKSMSSRRGRCVIMSPSPIVRQVLELTRLHKVFDICDETTSGSATISRNRSEVAP